MPALGASEPVLGCRACRRHDTGREGRGGGEISNRTGDLFATSYGPSRPMRGSGSRGSDVSDDRLWDKNCLKGQADTAKL